VLSTPTAIKKTDIEKWLSKGEAVVVDQKAGKSDIWQLFGRISHRDGFIKDFVACKACKKVYVFRASDGTQTLRKHSCDIGQSGPAAKRTRIEPKMPPFNWNTAGFTKSASPKVTTVPKATVAE